MKNFIRSSKKIILILFCGFYGMALKAFPDGENPIISPYKIEKESIYNTMRNSSMGGTASVFPMGFEALLYNPGGFSQKLKYEAGALYFGLGFDSYFRPEYLVPMIESIGFQNSSDKEANILINAKELITSSGVGIGTGFGFGFVPEKKSFGIGIYGGGTVYLSGKPFPLGTEGFIKFSINFPIGYSFEIIENSKCQFDIGISLTPEIAIIKNLKGSDVDALAGGTATIQEMVSDVVENPYYCVPINIGSIFTFLDKPYENAEIRFSFVGKNLFGNYFSSRNERNIIKKERAYSFGTGLYLPFDIMTIKCSGIFSMEIAGINQIIEGNSDFWKALKLGSELNIGNAVFLRGGLTSGYPSLGAEIKIFQLGLGFSWQTIEEGLYIGDNPVSVFRVSINIY